MINIPLHQPVMSGEVLSALRPFDNAVYLDATFGAGGHSRQILEAATCRVIGLDRDPEAVARGLALARDYPDRFKMIKGRFSDLAHKLADQNIDRLDGALFDLGVSSPQLDQANRGFSFQHDGPLDMRMDGPDTDGSDNDKSESAAMLLARLSEQEISHILYTYGEERKARRIARAIVKARQQQPLTTTTELADIIRTAVHTGGKKSSANKSKIDPATRSFQAIRIAVNQELEEISAGLDQASQYLATGGRLVVIAFHSLEDRIVKKFFRSKVQPPQPSRHMPFLGGALAGTATGMQNADAAPMFRLLTSKPVQPDADEIARNPRARSARLRAMEYLQAA